MSASELLENTEDIFPRYYVNSDSDLNSISHTGVLPVAKGLIALCSRVIIMTTPIQLVIPLEGMFSLTYLNALDYSF